LFCPATGLGILVVALLLRLLVTFVVLVKSNLTTKEKIFISIAWLPKATVQVCIRKFCFDYDCDKADFIRL
jgi:hypothetical protein